MPFLREQLVLRSCLSASSDWARLKLEAKVPPELYVWMMRVSEREKEMARVDRRS